MLKFSPANNKLRHLAKVKSLSQYLKGNKKIYSFDLLSGHTCNYAKFCFSSAVEQKDGGMKIVDGPHTDFRCFSASQEVLFKNVYKRRKENGQILEIAASKGYMAAADSLNKRHAKERRYNSVSRWRGCKNQRVF